ncbi:Calx-beta domain-containing protein [Colwelliaceae bacterium BS250]
MPKLLNNKRLSLLILLISFNLTGCDLFDSESKDKTDPIEPKPPVIVEPEDPAPPESSQLIISISNSGTSEAVAAGTLTVIADNLALISESDYVVDFINGEAVITINQDSLADNDANGFPDFAGELTVAFSASGYLSTNSKFVVDVFGDNVASMELVELSAENAPEGVALVQESVDLTTVEPTISDEGIEVISIITESDSSNNVTLEIPVDVVLLDDKGVALDTSKLEVVLTAFDTTVEGSADLLPGGLVTQVANANDLAASLSGTNGEVSTSEASEVRFISAGFVSIELTAGDQKASSLNSLAPIQVDIPLSANTINPITDQFVAEGDIIPTWSLSEGDAAWRYEGDGTVELNDNGNLIVGMALTHLSYYNLAWADVEETCSGSIYITDVNGDPYPIHGEVNFNNERASLTDNYNGATDGVFTYKDLPDEPTTFTFVGNSSSKLIEDKTTVVLGENGSIDTDAVVIKGIDLCKSAGSTITLQQTEVPSPVIDIYSVTSYIVEGDIENTIGEVKIRLLDGPENENVSFTYSLLPAPDSAYNTYYYGAVVDGVDFNAVASQVITFAAGETEKVITIDILADTTIEERYKFYQVQLTEASGAIFEKGAESLTVTGYVRDNDALYISDFKILSASEETGKLEVQITTEDAVPTGIENFDPRVSVNFAQAAGDSADYILDFHPDYLGASHSQDKTFNKTIYLPTDVAGVTVFTATIDIRDDNDIEGIETLTATLLSNDLVRVKTEVATVQSVDIADNDVVAAMPTSFTVTKYGSDVVYEGRVSRLLISLDTAPISPVMLDFTTVINGVETIQTLTFAANQSSMLLNVGVANDRIVSFDYDIAVTISSPNAALAGSYENTFRIEDDDVYYADLSVNLNQTEVVEGVVSEVDINLNYYSSHAPIAIGATLHVGANSTATQDVDFTVNEGNTSFTGENQTTPITVTILDDEVSEPSEIIELGFDISSITVPGKTYLYFDYYQFLINSNDDIEDIFTIYKQITIGNDDIALMFINQVGTLKLETDSDSFAEHTIPVTIEVQGAEESGVDVTFNLTTTDGTAQSGIHFGNIPATVTVPAGETSVTFDVPVLSVSLTQAGITEEEISTEVNFNVSMVLSEASRAELIEKDIDFVVSKKDTTVTITYKYIDPTGTGGTGGSSTAG